MEIAADTGKLTAPAARNRHVQLPRSSLRQWLDQLPGCREAGVREHCRSLDSRRSSKTDRIRDEVREMTEDEMEAFIRQ